MGYRENQPRGGGSLARNDLSEVSSTSSHCSGGSWIVSGPTERTELAAPAAPRGTPSAIRLITSAPATSRPIVSNCRADRTRGTTRQLPRRFSTKSTAGCPSSWVQPAGRTYDAFPRRSAEHRHFQDHPRWHRGAPMLSHGDRLARQCRWSLLRPRRRVPSPGTSALDPVRQADLPTPKSHMR